MGYGNKVIATFLMFSVCFFIFQVIGFAQPFTIENEDSCKIILCDKPWISIGINPLSSKMDSTIFDKIIFYPNGSYDEFYKEYSWVNGARVVTVQKKEKGKWHLGIATKYYGDPEMDIREIVITGQRLHNTLQLIDGTKTKNQSASLPRKPCIKYSQITNLNFLQLPSQNH